MKGTGLKRDGDVTPAVADVAARRTEAHVRNLALVDYDLRLLARNCYLQGMRDMAEAVAERVILPEETPLLPSPGEGGSSC